ncbi:hypothetical protein [Myxococcus qinghaiensis]|uniref:hypothetical protein n=1 Tax=Myxococcus qinghaiensis TaxID=2906758 RepID=UPI0020A7A060|nr:hypothetical protein [Myxococcus qinghaiensis]MCP3167307.1 hypothetical protein [Myxococcus qinghaiensis]
MNVTLEGKEYSLFVDGMRVPSNLDKLAVTMPDGRELVVKVESAWAGSAEAQPPKGALRARFVK